MNVISDPGARFPRAVREHNRLGPVGPQESRTFPSSPIDYVFCFIQKNGTSIICWLLEMTR